MQTILHKADLPDLNNEQMLKLVNAPALAIDTETQGLNIMVHRLCLVQISSGDGICHLVQLGKDDYKNAVNLKQLLGNKEQQKIFHYARFDVACLQRYLEIEIAPIYCTKIASKLVRTYGVGHGLSSLVSELLGMQLDKTNQTSDWAKAELSESQQHYAAQDVLYLHSLSKKLDEMLHRENRTQLFRNCCDFLPHKVALDGLAIEEDIFSH